VQAVSYRRLRITAAARVWHEPFFAHVAEVFPGVDFRRWAALGGWAPSYDVLAFTDADGIVASIGCTRMPLIVSGRARPALQLGAVATRAVHRGRGLARRLMAAVLAEADRAMEPVFLFANPTVLDFYPKFGFRRAIQCRFAAAVSIAPAGARAPSFDLDDAKARARLAALCARAMPAGHSFGTRDYYPILLWHLCNRPLTAHWLADGEALVVTATVGDRLLLHDIVAARPLDIASALPTVVTPPVTSIEFGFEPGAWWPAARPVGADESLLFIRGLDDMPTGAFRFPDLAQT
jgi:GNAT superfamily N-acetyltransferase